MKRLLTLLFASLLVISVCASCSASASNTTATVNTVTTNLPLLDKISKPFNYTIKESTVDKPIAAAPTKKYKIGVLLPHLTNPHFVAEAYGFSDEAKKFGVEAIIWECGGYANLDKQIQQMEDLITMKVDAICIAAVDPAGTVNVVDKAIAAGIPVINMNVMTNNTKVIKIQSDDISIGKLEAEYMGKALGGKGNVFMINGVAGSSWAIGRSTGFKDYMAKNYPTIKILTERWADNTPEAGLKEMDDGLIAYKGQINAVFTPGENYAKGVIQAITAASSSDPSLKDIIITSVDPSPDGVAAVKDGRISMMVIQSSVDLGRWSINAALKVLNGEADKLYSRYVTPLNMLSKDNVNTLSLEGISIAPAGWKLP